MTDSLSAGSRTFSRLRGGYLLALSLVAIAVVGELFVISRFIDDQRADAEIINIAGRQRMLSQRIAKQVALGNEANKSEIAEWQQQHDWLKTQLADGEIYDALAGLDPIMDSYLLALSKTDERKAGTRKRLNARSNEFLEEMEEIVDRLAEIATLKVTRLRRLTFWIGITTVGVLLLELVFIFWPIDKFVRRQFAMVDTERQAQKAARRTAERAVREKDETLRELYALHSAINEAALFASLRKDGTVTRLSKKFRALLGVETVSRNDLFAELVSNDHNARIRMQETLRHVGIGRRITEWRYTDPGGVTHHLDLTITPAEGEGTDVAFLVIATEHALGQ